MTKSEKIGVIKMSDTMMIESVDGNMVDQL